jgi:hypothetical protein
MWDEAVGQNVGCEDAQNVGCEAVGQNVG